MYNVTHRCDGGNTRFLDAETWLPIVSYGDTTTPGRTAPVRQESR